MEATELKSRLEAVEAEASQQLEVSTSGQAQLRGAVGRLEGENAMLRDRLEAAAMATQNAKAAIEKSREGHGKLQADFLVLQKERAALKARLEAAERSCSRTNQALAAERAQLSQMQTELEACRAQRAQKLQLQLQEEGESLMTAEPRSSDLQSQQHADTRGGAVASMKQGDPATSIAHESGILVSQQILEQASYRNMDMQQVKDDASHLTF